MLQPYFLTIKYRHYILMDNDKAEAKSHIAPHDIRLQEIFQFYLVLQMGNLISCQCNFHSKIKHTAFTALHTQRISHFLAPTPQCRAQYLISNGRIITWKAFMLIFHAWVKLKWHHIVHWLLPFDWGNGLTNSSATSSVSISESHTY